MTGSTARRVVLHAGARKTGSTALQQFLILNRDRLAERGVHVVRTAGADANHWRLLHTDAYFYADLGAEIATLGPEMHTVVFSAESLILRPPQALARVRRMLNETFGPASTTVVVVYLRNTVAHAQSLLLQYLAGGEIEPRVIQDLNGPLRRIEPTNLGYLVGPHVSVDFEACIGRVERYLAPDRIVPRLYDRSRFAGADLVSDFLEVLGIAPDDSDEHPVTDANPSLCVEAAWVLAKSFPEIIDCAARDELVRVLVQYDDPDRSTQFLRPATTAIVSHVHADAHRRLTRNYPDLEGLLRVDLPFGAPVESAAVDRCREFVERRLAAADGAS